MSLIRCLSNPEGLYIFNDGRHVNVWPPSGSKLPCMMIPVDVFYTAIKKYEDIGDDLFTYKDITIEETKQFKIKFTYQNRSIEMWQVTWDTIVKSATYGITWKYITSKKKRKRK